MNAAPLEKLGSVAELNPRFDADLRDDEPVAFLPMSAIEAERVEAINSETRPFLEVKKGYTPFRSDDVLIAKITPCFENGKIAQAKLIHRHGFGSTEFHVVRAKPEKLDPRFLAHFLRQKRVLIEGERKMTGSAGQRRVPEHFLDQLLVPCPPLPEQRRIAEILDKADALRAKRRAAFAQLDTLTQSIFLDMFGDPVTNPKAWSLIALRDVFADSPIYGTMMPPSPDKGTWLSLRVANIQDWELDLSDQKFVELPQATVSRHEVRDGDLLLARAIASEEHLGKAVVVYPAGRKWAFDSHLMRLRFDETKAAPEVIRALFRTPGGRRLFLSATRRSAVQFNINTKEISDLRIPLAPLEKQKAFLRKLEAAARMKAMFRTSLATLDSLFASIQKKAFQGAL